MVEKIIDILAIPDEKIDYVRRIFLHSQIDTRYSVVSDFLKPREEWSFWGVEFPKKVPGMTERNRLYKEIAPSLALEAARQALDIWGGDPSAITHLISVSCTGMVAPGIEYSLMKNLALPPTTDRLAINFMGCFGAFKGLAVAKAITQANPEARVLLVCTELCTLHMQASHDHEALMSNALFSDGASAVIVGGNCRSHEKPLWEIHRTHSLGFKDTFDEMSWEASDTGFLIGLSHTVPIHIKRGINAFVEGLLPKSIAINACDWAIHPGGPAIIEGIEKKLHLDKEQTLSSWKVLKDYGNMSSATFLFVLRDLAMNPSARLWTVGLGFGPGLSAEGIFLRRICHAH